MNSPSRLSEPDGQYSGESSPGEQSPDDPLLGVLPGDQVAGSLPGRSLPGCSADQGTTWGRSSGVIGSLQSLLGTIVIAVFVITFIVQAFQIPSPSMENTLLVGDYLLVNKLCYGGKCRGLCDAVPPCATRRHRGISLSRKPCTTFCETSDRCARRPDSH